MRGKREKPTSEMEGVLGQTITYSAMLHDVLLEGLGYLGDTYRAGNWDNDNIPIN